MRDADEEAEVEQEEIPSICQDEDSSSDESMGSYEDTTVEHEQSYGVDDSRQDLYSSMCDEQSKDSMGDIQDDESLLMIQPE